MKLAGRLTRPVSASAPKAVAVCLPDKAHELGGDDDPGDGEEGAQQAGPVLFPAHAGGWADRAFFSSAASRQTARKAPEHRPTSTQNRTITAKDS